MAISISGWRRRHINIGGGKGGRAHQQRSVAAKDYGGAKTAA